MEVEGGGWREGVVENSIKCTGRDDGRKYIALRTTTKIKETATTETNK